jgi:hypothetical protein
MQRSRSDMGRSRLPLSQRLFVSSYLSTPFSISFLILTGASLQALNEYSDHEVHLYEADSRPGGHANTVKFTNPQTGESCMVDMYVSPLYSYILFILTL